jgi:hypothetical protein
MACPPQAQWLRRSRKHLAERSAGSIHQVEVHRQERWRGQATLELKQDRGLADPALPKQHERVLIRFLERGLDQRMSSRPKKPRSWPSARPAIYGLRSPVFAVIDVLALSSWIHNDKRS